MNRLLNPVIVLDFDGVLGKTFSHPERPLPEVRNLIRLLSRSYYICVASYNPRAKLAIDDWKQFYGYDAIRCGANFKWSDDYCDEWRKEMSKSKQIDSMLEELGLGKSHLVYFFDDDQENVDQVNVHKSRTAFKIDTEIGLTFKDVKHLLGK